MGGEASAVEDLAMESWMLDRAAGDRPCVFFTSWPRPTVVLGYGQSSDDVDLEVCSRKRIPVLRRLTGGTGVVHVGDLGLSLALPEGHRWARGVLGLYDRFLGALEPALRQFETRIERIQQPRRAARVRSPICFLDQLSDTLLVGGRKAVGCAQTRRRGAVLVHAVILLGLDAELYAEVFRTSLDEVAAGLTAAIPGGDWLAVGSAVCTELADALGLEVARRSRPVLPDGYLERYGDPRWAPLPVGEKQHE